MKEDLKIRPLSRAAYRISHMLLQFQEKDVEDGILKEGTLKEVSETYDDNHIIGEAKYLLEIMTGRVNESIHEMGEPYTDYPYYLKQKKQLAKFLSKYA